MNWVKVYPEANGASVMPMAVSPSVGIGTFTFPEDIVLNNIIIIYQMTPKSTFKVPYVDIVKLNDIAVGDSFTGNAILGRLVIERTGYLEFYIKVQTDFGVEYMYYSPITLPE